ncbi:MAG: NAD-dependent epimerase/dehydratase family protein [Chloroflexi bacterium]|nr:NAD-dependent epimerase/dehydratase family protein [Chloroflexota bacterium]
MHKAESFLCTTWCLYDFVVRKVPAERVLITGARGLVGRALTRRLAADGAMVFALDREMPGRADRSDIPDGVEYNEIDLRYAAGIKRVVESASPAWVAHLAAVGVTDPFLPIGEALRGNVEATINLLRAVAGRCRVVAARTPGEIEAINTYAASKAAAWQFCRMFHRTEGWPVVGAMLFQVYGPNPSARTVLGAALKAAMAGESFPMTSGEQKRDWIYIDDVVNGIICAARADSRVDGETVELGTGIGIAVRDVVARLFEIVGKGRPMIGALPQRPGEPPEQIADADRAERLIGWRAKIGIDEGLRRLTSTDVSDGTD